MSTQKQPEIKHHNKDKKKKKQYQSKSILKWTFTGRFTLCEL